MNRVPNRPLSPFQIARKLYGDALNGADRKSIATSILDFGKLAPSERQFIQCHLAYLNLLAQERNQNLLMSIRDGLESIRSATFAIADEVTLPRLQQEWNEQEQEQEQEQAGTQPAVVAESEDEQPVEAELDLQTARPERSVSVVSEQGPLARAFAELERTRATDSQSAPKPGKRRSLHRKRPVLLTTEPALEAGKEDAAHVAQ